MTHGYPSEWEREGGGREGGGRDGGGRKEDGGEERRERQKRGGERRERGKIEHNFFKQSFVLSIMLHHPPCSVKVSGGVPKLIFSLSDKKVKQVLQVSSHVLHCLRASGPSPN